MSKHLLLMTVSWKHFIDKLNWDKIVETLVDKVVSLIVLIIVFIIIRHLIRFFVNTVLVRSLKLSKGDVGRKKTVTRLLGSLFNYILYFFIAYWLLAILGMPVSSLLAGAGMIGVAVGLGAKDFLADLINGFFILLERHFDVGDSVVLDDISGTVEMLGLRTTQIRGFDGTLYFIPNRNIATVSNLSRGAIRTFIDIPLYATADLEKVTQIVEQVNDQEIKHYPEIVDQAMILGPQVEEGRFSFRVGFFVKGGKQVGIYHTFYKLYQEALIKEGIELPTNFLAK